MPIGRRFQPGVSGNPNGRRREPPNLPEIQAICRGHAPECIATGIEIMRDKAVPPGVRLAAMTAIMDRGFGRPVQPIESNAPTVAFDFSGMSNAEIAAALALFERIIKPAAPPTIEAASAEGDQKAK